MSLKQILDEAIDVLIKLLKSSWPKSDTVVQDNLHFL